MINKHSLNDPQTEHVNDMDCTNTKNISDDITYNPILFDTGNESHADFLQKQGELKLEKGDLKALKLFELASSLEPENADLLYRQGVALAKYGRETKTKKYLLFANKKFKLSTKILAQENPSWAAWGDTLFLLGQIHSDHHFFLDAKDRYQKAISYLGTTKNENASEIYWNYGQVMVQIAESSEEVSDLNTALDAHARALSLNEKMPARFWQNFGCVSLKLGIQVNDVRLYIKAINCHKNAIAQSVSCFESWFYLADALSHLYSLTHDDDHFTQANECFTNAAKLHPQNDRIWLSWAKLLLSSGKRIKDPKRLHSALEKCHKAYYCNRNDEEVLIVWSEVFATLGVITDRLDYIYEANNKVAEALDQFGETVEVCYAQGINLFASGKYYNDIDYYYQAIEKFQEGLSIDRTKHKLWFHIAYTYCVVAEIESDPALYERAGRFYTRAINLHTDSTYYYEYACSLVKLADFNENKTTLETALLHFEQAFNLQKNAVYLHPDWLYEYALALDLMGDLVDEDKYYVKSIEILKRVLMLDPDFEDIHYKLAGVYSHLGELTEMPEVYQRAISHFKIAFQDNEENESLILDWSLCLINLAEITSDSEEREQLWGEAEYKLIQSAKLGNQEVYYHLACLYSLMRQYEKAMYFLEKAQSLEALPPLDDVLEDDWLENLRQTEVFRSFINHLSA